MGRKATFVKSRYQDFKHKKEQRQKRSDDIRKQRRGTSDADARLVQKVFSARPLPSKDQQELLFSQFEQACRLPGAPSEDLCRLIRNYQTKPTADDVVAAENKKATPQRAKRGREEDQPLQSDNLAEVARLAMRIVELANNEPRNASDDGSAAVSLSEIVCSESGSRVVSALLSVLSSDSASSSTTQASLQLQDVVLRFFEEDVHRLEHFVACKLIGVLCEHAGQPIRVRIGELLKKHVATADDDLEALKSVLTERHTAGILVRLLASDDVAPSVRSWISTTLQLTPPSNESAAAATPSRQGKGKSSSSATPTTPAKVARSNEEIVETLHALISDPNSAAVISSFVSDDNRSVLFQKLSFTTLMQSKRGNRLLSILMTPKTGAQPPVGAKWPSDMLETILMKESSEEASVSLNDMSYDSTGNFVVQSILKLLPLVATAEQALTYGRRVLDLMLPALSDMCRHPIAVHVVLTLLDAFAKSAEAHSTKMQPLFHQCVKQILGPDTVLELVRDRHGSLVTRKLIELFASAGAKSRADGRLLMDMLEQHMSALIYDPTGNLVAQQLIQADGISGAANFYQKFVKREDVLGMAQHPFAAHVLCALFDKGDVQTCTDLCGTLKPHVLAIAKHLNGRFVCERMLAANRDIRDAVARSFQHLVLQKGTQHLLVKLVETMEPAKRSTFFQNVVLPQFVALATNATASIVIQKLLQSSSEFLIAAKEFVKKQPAHVLRDMQQNFHGAFVARILTAAA